MMNPKVLFVDDDPELLLSFRRQLRRDYDFAMTTSGEMGLDMATTEGPFAVVVADMNMPMMNGIQFLTRMEAIQPNTARVMLTGYADLQLAMGAINEGHIFRFLTKPCSKESIVKVLEAGVRQYQLVTAERELLVNTLNGSISMLTEILSLANPSLFSQAARAKEYGQHIVRELNLPFGWLYELAFSLSHVGFIAYPQHLDNLLWNEDETSRRDAWMLAEYYKLSCRLIEKIPRLEQVGRIIEMHQKPYSAYSNEPGSQGERTIRLGAQILHVGLDLERRISNGLELADALRTMAALKGEYNPEFLRVLHSYRPRTGDWDRVRVGANFLREGMVLDQDVRHKDGTLLICRGHEVTFAVLKRLQNLHLRAELQEPFYVLERGA